MTTGTPAPHGDATWFDAFDRVAVISLVSRPDRRAAIDGELRAAFGLGVDDLGGFFDAVRPTDPGSFHSVGERGCFESHLEVLRAARHDGVRNLLVLEDDAEFTADVAEALRRATDDLMGHEWDQAYFGYVDAHGDTFGAEYSQVAGGTTGVRWLRITGRARQAHCVAFRPKGMDLAIRFLETCHAGRPGDRLAGPMTVDGAYNVLGMQDPTFVRLGAAPPLVGQRPSRSDISPSLVDRMPLLRPLNQMRRRMRERVRPRP